MAITSIILGTIAVGAGIYEGVEALGSQPKTPGTPAAPSTAAAATTANAAETAQRKDALATGGLTDYTGGQGILLGSDVSQISLVGN